MRNWFKKKKRQIIADELSKTPLRRIDYDAKIMVAWGQAIEGNQDILQWLNDNGYEELVRATYAIYLKEKDREWLQMNGYAHLLAMINAAEGNESAQQWLRTHNFEILYHIAMAVEDEPESFKWLNKHTTPDIFMLAKSIKKVKDQIEFGNNDIYSFGRET